MKIQYPNFNLSFVAIILFFATNITNAQIYIESFDDGSNPDWTFFSPGSIGEPTHNTLTGTTAGGCTVYGDLNPPNSPDPVSPNAFLLDVDRAGGASNMCVDVSAQGFSACNALNSTLSHYLLNYNADGSAEVNDGNFSFSLTGGGTTLTESKPMTDAAAAILNNQEWLYLSYNLDPAAFNTTPAVFESVLNNLTQICVKVEFINGHNLPKSCDEVEIVGIDDFRIEPVDPIEVSFEDIDLCIPKASTTTVSPTISPQQGDELGDNGVFSGTGVIDNGNGSSFDLDISDAPATYLVTYDYQLPYTNLDGTPCTFTTEAQVSIQFQPQLTCPPNSTIQCISDTLSSFTNITQFLEAGGTVEDGCGEVEFKCISQTIE